MVKLLLRAVLAFSALPASAAEPRWLRAASPDFEIFSSASESDTRRTLQQFDRAKGFLEHDMRRGVRRQPGPVRVVLFGSNKEYNEYRFKTFTVAYSAHITGRDYVVLGGAADDVFSTAVHEYIHLLMQDAGPRLPPWFSEGIAELYSTLKPAGDKAVVGAPPPARVQALGREKWVPLSEILSADHDSPYYNQTAMAGSLYNQGWALVHMLEFNPRYGPRFAQFMEIVEQGTPSRKAFEIVYGKPLETIERDLKAYLRRGYFATRMAFAQPQSANAAAVEPASMFDVNLALLDLASRLGKTAETRAGLERLMRENPRRPEPHVTLGYLLVRNNREEEAFHSFETAVNLGSRDAQMLWDYGRLAAATEPVQAMRVLKLLLADQPSRADARLELAEIQMSRGGATDAVVTLEPVQEVAPGDAHRLYQILTIAHLELGNRRIALGHARRWFKSAQDHSQRTNASRILHSLEDAGK